MYNMQSYYLSNQKQFKKSDLENIISQIAKPYFIIGDFNSHTSNWSSEKIDNRGKKIDNYWKKTP